MHQQCLANLRRSGHLGDEPNGDGRARSPGTATRSRWRKAQKARFKLSTPRNHSRPCPQENEHAWWVDEIEVFLAYESGLRERLDLPVSAENMLFAGCAKVTAKDLSVAQKDVQKAMRDGKRVDAYLENSAVWQRHLRQQKARTWSWEEIKPEPLPQSSQPFEELVCKITLEPFAALRNPVLVERSGIWQAYESAALLKYWVEHGKDSLNQPLDFAGLRRPPLPMAEGRE
jgi:hypothetical protein